MWDVLVVAWGWFDWCAGVLAYAAASCTLGLAIAAHFRLNRIEADRASVDSRVDDRLYALEEDSGIGPGGCWAERARMRH